MISELIVNYGKLGMQGVLVILMVWLVWYLIRSIMGMFKNELKELHQDSLENAKLNNETIVLIKEHTKETKEDNAKFAKVIGNLLKASNGSNPAILKLQKEFKLFKEKIK